MALRPTKPEDRTTQLAQRDAAQQDVFMREVDEALRQDQMLGAAKQYGRPVGAAIAAGLLALAGFLYWQHSQDAAKGAQAEKFTAALDAVEGGQLPAGKAALAPLTRDGPQGSRAAAAMLEGAIALEQGNRIEAAKRFSALAGDPDTPQAYRDLATVREVALEFETMPADRIVARLKPLAQPGNAWFGNAAELLGMAYLKQGKPQLAGPLFAAIAKDKTAPDSLRARTRQLAGLLGFDAIDDLAAPVGGGKVELVGAAK